jgi:hypothetical protein
MPGVKRESRRTLSNHTRTCNKLPDVYVQTRGVVMELDRGVLARIDRKLLAGLGQDETFQMATVPGTAAKWATWKRHCDAAGISMGRAIMALIDHELVSVFGESTGDRVPLLAGRAEEQLEAREARIDVRERDVREAEERIGRQDERLRLWEDQLAAREQRAELATKLASRPTKADAKVGRNEPCPCGSGSKYKRCHGAWPDKPPSSVVGSGCEPVEDRLSETDADGLDAVGGDVRAEPLHGEADTGCGRCAEQSFQIAEGCSRRGAGNWIVKEVLETFDGPICAEMQHQPIAVGRVLCDHTVGSCFSLRGTFAELVELRHQQCRGTSNVDGDGSLVCQIHGGDRHWRPIDQHRFEPVSPTRSMLAMAGEASAAASGSG